MPPFIKRRGRSSRDAVKWKCGVCKRVNRPTKHLIFDLPKFRCKCGKKFEDDFHCCLSEVKVNGRLLLGDIHDQGSTEHCVAFAFAHQLEMTLRLKALLKKRNPLSVKKLCGHKLFYKFKKRCKDYFPKKESIIKKRAYIKEVHMGLILKEEGLENEDDQVCKVSNVSTIPRDDFEGIAKSIADGDSLVSSFNSGKRLSELKYGQIYKAYSRSRYRDNKRKKLTGHAVCLIGVGRKKGRPYYTFVNSWRKFCVRRNRRKKIYKWGVGRERASDLKCSAIRLSRFSEAGDDWSLQPQQGTVLNEHNLGLMMASSRKIKNELEINVDESDDDCEAPVVTAIHDEGNSSRNGASYSTYLQNRPSSSIGVPASSIAKPSALRMPSPSVGFFSQEKALVSHEDAAQGNANNCFSRNTSSLARPPRYKQSEYVNSWLSQAPVSSGDNGQGNAKICVTRNASALAKPPRYKQPDDYKSKLCLRAPLSTNCLANSEPLVHPVSNTLASPLPGLEHDNVCSRKESLSEVRTTCFANSRNRNNEPTRKVDCFSAGSGSTTRSPGSEKNGGSRDGVSNAYIVASHVEGRGIINRTEPNEDSHSLKSMCYSTTEHVAHETICSSMEPVAVSNLSSSCISEVCTLDDFICQSKSENCAGVAIDLENSLPGETMVAVSLSEGNKCTSGPDFLRGFDSCNQQRTECSTLTKSVESATCADGVPPCGNSVDIKPASADGTTDLHGSFCNEAECNLSVEPNTDGGVDFDSDNPLIGKEVQLSVGCDWEHDYRNAESSPIEPAAHMRSADFNDLKEVTVDCTTETNDSLAVERRPLILEEPSTEEDMDLDSDSPPIGNKVQLLIGSEYAHGYRSTEFSPYGPRSTCALY